jgi:ethanolamine ammonia-lyase large subunit
MLPKNTGFVNQIICLLDLASSDFGVVVEFLYEARVLVLSKEEIENRARLFLS